MAHPTWVLGHLWLIISPDYCCQMKWNWTTHCGLAQFEIILRFLNHDGQAPSSCSFKVSLRLHLSQDRSTAKSEIIALGKFIGGRPVSVLWQVSLKCWIVVISCWNSVIYLTTSQAFAIFFLGAGKVNKHQELFWWFCFWNN